VYTVFNSVILPLLTLKMITVIAKYFIIDITKQQKLDISALRSNDSLQELQLL